MPGTNDKAAKTTSSALAGIPFGTLIGAPLQAAVEAQALAAKTSYEFIETVGMNTVYNKDGTVKSREAVNVSFEYVRGGEVVTLNVPLITIIQVPYFEIRNMSINFKAKMSAESSSVEKTAETTAKRGATSGSARAGWGAYGASAKFNASYSSKKDSEATSESKYSVEYTMDIGVQAGQGDMPAGMATVLNILQGSIQEDSSSSSKLKLFVKPKSVKITDVNGAGADIKGFAVFDGVQMDDGETLYYEIKNTDAKVKLENTTNGEIKIGTNNELTIKLKKSDNDLIGPYQLKIKFGKDKNLADSDSTMLEVEIK